MSEERKESKAREAKSKVKEECKNQNKSKRWVVFRKVVFTKENRKKENLGVTYGHIWD